MGRLWLIAGLTLVSASAQGSAKPRKGKVPDAPLFTVGPIVVGQTTLEEVTRLLGEAAVVQPEHPEAERDHLCYKQRIDGETWFLAISADFPQRSMPVTGFRMSTHFHDWKCAAPRLDLRTLASGNGVRLGMSRADFTGRFNFEFTGMDMSVTADRHTYGQGPCGEKARRRHCKRVYEETFHATFSDDKPDGKLTDYEVVRTLAVF